MEPISIIVGAAIGGASGKFVEKLWDSGEKWIQSYYKDHKEISLQNAINNTMEFLNELSIKVKHLEESNQITAEILQNAQNHPDFSILLQKALLASSQTDQKEKHFLLARLVSERLCYEPESILALSTKMACDVISFITKNQLMILGLVVNINHLRPDENFDHTISNFKEYVDSWIIQSLKPYQNIEIRNIDLKHLESLSCIKINSFISPSLNDIYSDGVNKYVFNRLTDIELRDSINTLWDTGLCTTSLTTVGQIIGVATSDLITNTTTKFIGWE